MANKLISVIIPTYQRELLLLKTLTSILNQTYKTIEVIVVNDGGAALSTATSLSINNQDHKHELRNQWFKLKDQFASQNIPFFIFSQPNKGAPAARNTGLAHAKGEYVIFWDADIIAETNMLETLLFALESQPAASFAYCNYRFGWKKMPAQTFDPEMLRKNNYIVSTSLVRKEVALCWDESLKRFQDWDYWLTLTEQGKVGVFVDQYLFTINSSNGTMSAWLPAFAYRWPWCRLPWFKEKVAAYKRAKSIVEKKHQL